MFSPIHEYYACTYRGRPTERYFERNGVLETVKKESSQRYFEVKSSGWNDAGKIGFVCIISGSCRFLLGALDVIVGLFKAIFFQQKNPIFTTGLKNCIRGLVEAGPGIYLMSKGLIPPPR